MQTRSWPDIVVHQRLTNKKPARAVHYCAQFSVRCEAIAQKPQYRPKPTSHGHSPPASPIPIAPPPYSVHNNRTISNGRNRRPLRFLLFALIYQEQWSPEMRRATKKSNFFVFVSKDAESSMESLIFFGSLCRIVTCYIWIVTRGLYYIRRNNTAKPFVESRIDDAVCGQTMGQIYGG